MNLIDAYVSIVDGKPFQNHGRWWLNVIADIYGVPGTATLMFDTEEEALAVKPGHHFLT